MSLVRMFALLLVAAAAAPAWANRGQTTPEEFKAMEPACQAIGMGSIDGKFWAEALGNSPILDKPENAMAKGAGWFHHYCWGKLSKLRYYSAKTAEKRKSAIHVWRGEMEYIVKTTGERGLEWGYMHVIHKEIAESYLFEKNYGQAIIEGEKALALDRDYVPAYVVIADAYAGANKRDKALETATEGLKHAPESRPLKRRYTELGGKLPYPEPYVKAAGAAEAAPVENPATAKVQPEPVPAPPSDAPPESAGQTETPPIVESPKQPGANPYCRFCP